MPGTEGAQAPEADAHGLPAGQTPVARLGLALMLGLLALVLALGIARNGLLKALGDLGFRNPAIAVYTLLLLSPLFFEAFYPRLRRASSARVRAVVENLHAHAPYLIVIGLVMLVMRLENIYDLDLTAALGLDWTRQVYLVEGDAVARIQSALRRDWLDVPMRVIYVGVYALYHVVALVAFAAAGRTAMVKRFTLTWTGIYAVALPFYVLAPVNETWTTNPAYGCYPPDIDFATSTVGVQHAACGDDGGLVLGIASINNCFPSLHNAFAWALPMLLWRSGWRRAAAATSVVALLISVSTLYLGIHWLTDLAAGVLLAGGVTWAAVRLDFTLTHGLALRQARWSRVPEPAA